MHDNKGNFLFGYGENDIDRSNRIDGKPIIFLVNESDYVIDSSSNASDVYCINCRNITVKDQIIKDNFAGIYLQNTTGSCITNNTLLSNSLGISLIDSSDNIIVGNRLHDNIYGTYLKAASENNTITGNNITYNEYGVFINIDGNLRLNNMIFNNTLANNKRNNAFSRGPNNWDNGAMGNHYSDYSMPGNGCSDENGDGICDRAYKIPGGSSVDRYPIAKSRQS